ncbi:unnamed protein product [Allacma fusca]|uniref:Tetraspanin n=1 Tax=Allacma fusca TaxID=39272 RepID=A0A8J2J9T6_9HEXA|nr:unnamed protein product [Allacma fusca]
MDSSTPSIVVKRRTASAGKYGFLLVALMFIGVLIGYAFAFVRIGPADRVQEIGYVVLFAVTSGLVLVSLVAFFIVLVGYGGNRFIGGIYISLVFLLLGSMLCAALFNWSPDAKSASKTLRNSLRRTGKPSQFIEYVQRHGQCCGAYGLSDYKSSAGSYYPLPASCCSNQSCIQNVSLATQGCLLRIPGRWNFVCASTVQLLPLLENDFSWVNSQSRRNCQLSSDPQTRAQAQQRGRRPSSLRPTYYRHWLSQMRNSMIPVFGTSQWLTELFYYDKLRNNQAFAISWKRFPNVQLAMDNCQAHGSQWSNPATLLGTSPCEPHAHAALSRSSCLGRSGPTDSFSVWT